MSILHGAEASTGDFNNTFLMDSVISLTRNAFDCGAGGGCIWALGPTEDVDKLKGPWESILKTRKGACLLDAKIDPKGLL